LFTKLLPFDFSGEEPSSPLFYSITQIIRRFIFYGISILDNLLHSSRTRWTDFVAREAERRGFAWAYWEFCSGFGVYDWDAGQWKNELLDALLPD
jgi:hypothetical protein